MEVELELCLNGRWLIALHRAMGSAAPNNKIIQKATNNILKPLKS